MRCFTRPAPSFTAAKPTRLPARPAAYMIHIVRRAAVEVIDNISVNNALDTYSCMDAWPL